MLKHKDIIDKLTQEQKVALLTDSREDFGKVENGLVIPQTSLNGLWEENQTNEREELFPSFKSLANSWDEDMAGEVARCLASMGTLKGDNLFVLPSPSASMSVYGKEMSEEPYLSSKMVTGMAKKLGEGGFSFCLEEPCCNYEDIRFLDKEVHYPALFDRIARPFTNVIKTGRVRGVLLKNNKPEGEYAVANKLIFEKSMPKDLEQIVKIEDGDMTTSALTSGKQLIGGSSLVISTALENYKRIYRSMEEGGATAQELNMTLADGASISEEIIDNALDKKIELAKNCSKGYIRTSSEDIKNIAYKAALESCVLVKNERALPLSSSERISVIGDIINDGDESRYKGFKDKLLQAISKSGNPVMGFKRGYSIGENVTPELIEPACTIASSGGCAIAFVGMGASRENRLNITARLTLPGNQIALLTKLRESVKKLIVVVCGESLPDMSFDNLADAILLVPSCGSFVPDALWDILSGDVSPCGRLAYAGYTGIDTSIREQQKRKKKNKQTIGPFIGYRYLDSNGEKTKYPVGYGLSYTTFEYTRIQVDRDGVVSFNIRNTGRMDGYEIAQVYVGMTQSKRIRPRRELKGSVKVFLKAGEKKSVSLKLENLEIFNTASKEFVLEAGTYDIYVSSAFGKDYAVKKMNFSGVKLVKEDKRLSDYLQNVSNIVSEGYTMEAYCKPMNLKSKLKSFGIVLFILLLFADAIYAICCEMMDIDFTDSQNLTIFAAVNGIALALSILSIIIGNAGIRRRKRALAKREIKATEELFKTVKPTNVKSIDELFDQEFDISLEAVEKKEIEYSDKDESTYTFMAVDTDIPTLSKELEAHFAEYGYIITPRMARKILSAIMTSRLLVVRSALGVSCEKVTEILSRFFGTEPHCEDIKGAEWRRNSLLRYTNEGESVSRPAPLLTAINSANNERDKACFFGIANARFRDFGNMLMPYVQYFGNPDVEHSVIDENGSINMPSNLWFVISPAKDESLDDIPAFVANISTLVDIEAQSTNERDTKTARKYITTHQLDALIFRAKKGSEINENLWKGVDSLEAFVSEKTPYRIGNKLFLQMEKYLAIYNACEADLNEAMDCAVAGKLIPAILNLLKNNESMQDTDLAQVVESFFGEEYASNCRNTIKRLVINKVGAEKVVKEETTKEEAKEEPINEETNEQSTSQAPVEEEGTSQAPVEEESTSQAPTEEESANEVPVEEESANEVPVEEEGTSQSPVEEETQEEKQGDETDAI